MNVLEALAANAPLKDGAYVAVVANLKPKLIVDADRGYEAIRFTIKVVEGADKGAWPRSSFSSGLPIFKRPASGMISACWISGGWRSASSTLPLPGPT